MRPPEREARFRIRAAGFPARPGDLRYFLTEVVIGWPSTRYV